MDPAVSHINLAPVVYDLSRLPSMDTRFCAASLVLNRTLTVVSNGNAVLDAKFSRRRVLFIDRAKVTLIGLRIRGGDQERCSAESGAGVWIRGTDGTLSDPSDWGPHADVTMINCSVHHNRGTGIWNDANSSLVMHYCEVHNNVGSGGNSGGIFNAGTCFAGVSYGCPWSYGIPGAWRSTLAMYDSSVYANVGCDGAGISGPCWLERCRIFGNANGIGTQCSGGGVASCNYQGYHLLQAPGETVIIDSNIYDNRAEQAGGGVLITAGSHTSMFGCNVFNNTAEADGGGLMIRPQSYQVQATLTDCRIFGNLAVKWGAGGIANKAANLTLIGTMVFNNTALTWGGGGITNGGDGTVANLTMVNSAVYDNINFHGHQNLWNWDLSRLVYVLPAPRGHYLDSSIKCEQFLCCAEVCDKGCGPAAIPSYSPHPPPQCKVKIPCKSQLCSPGLVGKHVTVVPQKSGFNDTFPPRCAPGFYGNSTDPLYQASAICEGPCSEGHYCARKGTVLPTLAPAGFYAPRGSVTPLVCGSRAFYCPGGTANPLPVGPGNESYSELEDSCTTECTSQRACRDGKWCSAGQGFNCTANTYADGSLGVRKSQAACKDCPFNTTTIAPGRTSPTDCICAPGFFRDLGNCTDDGCHANGCVSCPGGFQCCAQGDACAMHDVNTTSAQVCRPTCLITSPHPCPSHTNVHIFHRLRLATGVLM